MPEEQITDADIERMKQGFALFNAGDFDALSDFIAEDVLVERTGSLEPLRGWDAFRAMQEPDAFEWQTIEPLEWSTKGDLALLHVRIRSKGAMSGLVLEQDGWMLWRVEDHLVVHIRAFTDEQQAREAFHAPAGPSS